MHKLKKQSSLVPVAVGFGISGADQVRQVRSWGADGVIVGSALVKRMAAAALETAAQASTFCQGAAGRGGLIERSATSPCAILRVLTIDGPASILMARFVLWGTYCADALEKRTPHRDEHLQRLQSLKDGAS